MRLLIDLNSIVTSSLRVGKDPDGFKAGGETINTWEYGYSNFLNTFRKTTETLAINPIHVIGVFDTANSRKKRQRIFPQYKQHRAPHPKEYYIEFNTCMDTVKQFIRQLGGTLVSVKETEADDVIAHIAPKIESIIWSKDKDLLSIGTPMFIDGTMYLGETCDDKFSGILRRHIRLHRTLVGDAGDFGSGASAKGFGDKSFTKLWIKYGDAGLDAICDIINEKKIEELEGDINDFPALQCIVDSAELLYPVWRAARWLPIKDHKLNWEPGFTQGSEAPTFDDDFLEFYQTKTLVTADNFEELKQDITAQAAEGEIIPLDIETDVPTESVEWLKDIAQYFDKGRCPIKVDVIESKLAGLSITVGNNLQHTYYFSVNHADTANIDTLELRDFILSIAFRPFIAHSAGGFELPVLFLNWGVWLPDCHCSLIASSYVDENRYDKGSLKGLSLDHFQYKQQTYEDITQGRGMFEITGKEVFNYGCDDSIMSGNLFNFFETVMEVEGTFDAYVDVEQYTMYMIAHAFVNGVNCDLDFISKLKTEDKKAHDIAYKKIQDYLIKTNWPGAEFVPLEEMTPAEIKRGYYILYGKKLKTRFRILEKIAALIEDETFSECVLTGNLGGLNQYLSDNFVPRIEFKPGSTKHKATLMYEIMALPVRYRNALTDTQKSIGQTEGNICADEDTVKWAIKDVGESEEKEVLEAVLRCMNFITRNGLYYSSYPHLVHWRDEKLHPSLRQSITTSRRFAPSGPNVNQMPKRSEEGRKIRRAVVAHHQTAVIVSPDLKAQELRLGAFVTLDANFLACYIGDNKKDLHTTTAYEICKKQNNEFTSYYDLESALESKDNPMYEIADTYRSAKGKPTNFLSQYTSSGGGAWTLGKQLQISEKEAESFLEAKSLAFPGVDLWKEDYGRQVQTQGYAETLLGARKHIAKLLHTCDINYLLRSSLNFRIQSSSAEQTKRVLVAIWKAGLMDRYDVRFYFPVHDELCFSVARVHLVAFCAELKPLMTQTYANMTVPIESSLSVGFNFGQLDEIEWDETTVWLEKQEITC